MKVHHFNCGTMHPVRGPKCVCHVLLLETANGLVLVDAGFGIDDCADPKGRVGPVRFVTRPVFESTEAAAHQLDRLGFRREDVRHIVLTHLDTDPANTPSQVAAVTQALLDRGFSDDEIRKVMGGNVIRVLLAGMVPGK